MSNSQRQMLTKMLPANDSAASTLRFCFVLFRVLFLVFSFGYFGLSEFLQKENLPVLW